MARDNSRREAQITPLTLLLMKKYLAIAWQPAIQLVRRRVVRIRQ